MYGLVAFGRALGVRAAVRDIAPEYTEEVERVLGYGYQYVYRCEAGVGLTDLAVEAAERALTSAGLAATDVDLLVLAVTDITEYLYWDAAAAVAARLGANRAEVVLLTQACTSGIVCLDTVAGRFATHPDYQTALVVAANRTSEAYWNRLDTQPLLFSDGAAAAVARRDHPGLRWRASEAVSDGRYVDFFRLDRGGAAQPFSVGESTSEAFTVRNAWDLMEHFDFDADKFSEFMHQLDVLTRTVVEAACTRAGRTVDDVSRLILIHDTTMAYELVAAELEVPLERTNIELASAHGHLGAADQLHDLAVYHDGGALTKGDLVALAGRGRGMHWACALLEV